MRFALASHRLAAEQARKTGTECEIRVGLHLGEVTVSRATAPAADRGNGAGDDGESGPLTFDVDVQAQTTAARLLSLAGPRQTLLTAAAFDLARRGAVREEGDTEVVSIEALDVEAPGTGALGEETLGTETLGTEAPGIGAPGIGEPGTGALGAEAPGIEMLGWLAHGDYVFSGDEAGGVFEVGARGFAPLSPPAATGEVSRAPAQGTILGWRPAPGLTVPQRPDWVVERKLGEGGFGEVWLAGHAETRERRVFKFCYDAERLRSLQREITVFRLLKEELGERDDIARLIDWNLEKAPYFIESAYTAGGSLVDWSAARGGIAGVDLGQRLELIAQVATALEAAHSVGVLHKDVKPANVLITRGSGGVPEGRPRAVLTDFGLGLVTDHELLMARGITILGLTEGVETEDSSTLLGTRVYMAPELVTGHAPTIQSDVYALGVMLYQVVVGDLDRPLAPGWERDVDDQLLREDIADFADGRPRHRPRSALEVANRLRTLEERRAAREAERRARQKAEEAARQARAAAAAARRRRRFLTTVAALSTVFLVVVSVLAVQALRAREDADRRRVAISRSSGAIWLVIGWWIMDRRPRRGRRTRKRYLPGRPGCWRPPGSGGPPAKTGGPGSGNAPNQLQPAFGR